ncbi:polymeric immunoglobulin receptor-like [Mustelus asterias]
MWILILLICSLPVSGALWAETKGPGIVGRSITVNCHYDAWWYKAHFKYWCHGTTRQCKVVAKTNWQNGRISITDDKSRGVFVVTVKDLRSGDAGWYSCGIEKAGLNPMCPVELQISDEPVSVPELRFLSPPNASCSGGSVSVSCESVQGSLPIQYTWYEKTPSEDSKISDTNKLDLHCQSFKQQHHQYYCTASNNQGEKSSEMVTLSGVNRTENHCRYVVQNGSHVSDALWAETKGPGIVGRSITVNCHYDAWWYKAHFKYWCHGTTRQCKVVAKTNWQNGRISITDDKSRGVFVVTVKDLRSGDAGWYSCGIEKAGLDPMCPVELQVSDEPVSVPALKFLSPSNASCSGGSVSVSCESVQGSLPIRYTWYEKTPSEDSKISDANKLDLHCQSFTQQHHQYYCTASNNQGEKSSEMVNESVINRPGENCSYVIQINSIVSGALWAKKEVRGIVGRSITIDCNYGAEYRSHVKYWCRGWTRQCAVVATTNQQNGRISITDNKSRRVFVVTMKDLRSGDAEWYNCGIEASGLDPLYNVKLQISNEPVSVPELRFLSPPNASCSGGSVPVSCESVQGSLPIQYTWYEKTPSEDSKISDINKLDLHCQFFTQQHHQYYCTASNNQGEKSSEMVNVSVINRSGENCSYVTQINIEPTYSCGVSTTESPTTTHSTSTNINSAGSESSELENDESLVFIVVGVLGGIFAVFAVSLLLYLKINKGSSGILCHRRDKTLHDNQQLAALEESIVYAKINHTQRNAAGMHREGNAPLDNDEITYAAVQFQNNTSTRRGEVSRHSINNPDSVIYSAVSIPSQPAQRNPETPRLDTPQESEMTIYANFTH